jgi:hypothetical protein
VVVEVIMVVPVNTPSVPDSNPSSSKVTMLQAVAVAVGTRVEVLVRVVVAVCVLVGAVPVTVGVGVPWANGTLSKKTFI